MSAWLVVLTGPVIALAVLSALASALETALFSLDQDRRRALRRQAPAAAHQIDALFETPRSTVNSLLLGDSLLNFLLIFLCLWSLQGTAFIEDLPSWAVAALVFSALVLLCELIPKLVALQRPVPILAAGAGFAGLTIRLLGPLAGWIEGFGRRIVGVMPHETDPAADAEIGREELLHVFELAGKEGSISEAEADMLAEIVKLGRENATHCMTPRVDLFSIPDDLDNDAARALLRTRRYHRIPVYGQSPDDILGVLDVKKFLLDPDKHYTEQLQPPAFVPATMGALPLLHSFLLRQRRFATLLDEYGGTEGVVTLSDLIDELVGEEQPGAGAEPYIEMIGDGDYLVSGGARLDDLAEELGWQELETGADTLGGLLAEIHGSIPRPGTAVAINGWEAVVRRASRKRIKEVRLSRSGHAGSFTAERDNPP